MPSPDLGVTDLLRRASDDLAPDIDRLVRGGVSRGRSRQRRTRIGTTVASAAVFGVIGTLAVVVPRADGPDSVREADIAREPSTAGSVVEAPPPAATERALADFGPAAIAGMVDGILGTGLAAPPRPTDTVVGGSEERIAYFPYDGMETAVSLQLNQLVTVGRCEEINAHLGGSCAALPDGTVQLTWGPTLADGVTCQGVSAYRHGYVVSATSCNAATGKDSPPLAPQPPLATDQLTAVATSEVWFD
ncbi:hypothetical protein [Nocardioides hwasunensis]|uniref:Uncharacterized protein n=1 Tax=Nocardioides hwasunensis TaxID=397258 RepID=A0ABR8MKQ1_9ACTN|nr:hypothetical protein [Nocardioides hwasunensis]MBD3916595.1 hypothetical protein [Nocardioides hwasunensis]